MTALLIIFALTVLVLFLPKTAIAAKVFLELLIIAFYAVALILIGVIMIRSQAEKKNENTVRPNEINSGR